MLVTRKPFFRRALQAVGLIILAASLTGLGAFYYVGHLWSGHRTFAPVQQTQDFIQAVFHPEQLFPGQSRLHILCLGLDRNWPARAMPHSKGTRSATTRSPTSAGCAASSRR